MKSFLPGMRETLLSLPKRLQPTNSMEMHRTRFTDKEGISQGPLPRVWMGYQGNSSIGSLLYKQEKLSSTSAPQGKQDGVVHACNPDTQEMDTGESLELGD